MKMILMVGLFLTSLSVLADGSARRECTKDARTHKNSEFKTCEKKTGDERSTCRKNARDTYDSAVKRCEARYPRK